MKKIKSTVLVVLLLAAIMPSCKKGENDPAISFHSRKARVANEWKVTSGEGKRVETGSFAYSSSWTFDGSVYTETDASGSNLVSRTIEYEFDKDGNFKYTDTENGEPTTVEGTWNFASGVGETKKKSQLVLSYNKITTLSGVSTYDGFYPFATFEIDELRNKKMVLTMTDKGVYSSSTHEETEKWVLEAK